MEPSNDWQEKAFMYFTNPALIVSQTATPNESEGDVMIVMRPLEWPSFSFVV